MRDQEHYEGYWARLVQQSTGEPLEKGALREEYITDYFSKGKRVLDVGCGGGSLVDFAKDWYQEIHGVDISEVALQTATKRGMLCQPCNLNAESLPYEAGYFDTVVALDVVEHVFDPFHFFRECNRVLKPGGGFILSTPNIGSVQRRLQLLIFGRFPLTTDGTYGYDGGHLHYWTPKDIVALGKKHGFKKVHITGLGRFRALKELWPNLLTSGSVFHFVKVDNV
jgi:methionine biosynthesis protein MetW